MAKVNIKSEKITPFGGIYYASNTFYGSVKKCWGNKKHKKNILLPMPVLRTCRQHCGMSDFK